MLCCQATSLAKNHCFESFLLSSNMPGKKSKLLTFLLSSNFFGKNPKLSLICCKIESLGRTRQTSLERSFLSPVQQHVCRKCPNKKSLVSVFVCGAVCCYDHHDWRQVTGQIDCHQQSTDTQRRLNTTTITTKKKTAIKSK